MSRPRWGEQLASDSVQERTREAAAHERIVDHMILLRLLLAFATGQRGSASADKRCVGCAGAARLNGGEGAHLSR